MLQKKNVHKVVHMNMHIQWKEINVAKIVNSTSFKVIRNVLNLVKLQIIYW